VTELLSYLYLGTQKEASRVEELRRREITHLLSVAGGFQPPDNLRQYLEAPLTVHGVSTLEGPINLSFEFIEGAKAENGKTLLFCQFAQNRSPSIAISYLMKSQGWSLKKAYEFVLSKKLDISPHQFYFEQLQRLDLELFGKLSYSDNDRILNTKQAIARFKSS